MSQSTQENKKRSERVSHFRLALIDDKSHKQLITLRFTRGALVIGIISLCLLINIIAYCIIAFTPLKTFIPGYPDEVSKRAAIQNAITIDSLETVIFKWELYSENLRRVVEGKEPVRIDSLINITQNNDIPSDKSLLSRQDSLLRRQVKDEEQFDISDVHHRDLPIDGLHFFSPLKGVISQDYDPVIHPYIDITAEEGAVVKAALDGTVISAGWTDDAGNTIQIQHKGDIVTIYKHCDRLLKKPGDKVTAGTPIGIIGNSGNTSNGAHLHFELWHNGESVNPNRYINF